MTSISITALKGKTIREILELIHQAESLPENHGPTCGNVNCPDSTHWQEGNKNQTAQELLDELNTEEKS